MRRYLVLLTAVAALTLVGAASADVKQSDTESPTLETGPNCDVTGYKSEVQVFTPAFAIPDNNRAAALVGTLPTVADGSTIADVILEVQMNHTWMGDVLLRLEYVNCATGLPLYGTNVLCRPRGTNVTANAPCGAGTGVGCSGNLGSSAVNSPQPASVTYRFSDAALAPIGDGACPTVAPPGCYKPSPGGTMVGFNGLLKGGCWVLRAGDYAGLDFGFINAWTVWERNETPVPTKIASWGSVKTIYR